MPNKPQGKNWTEVQMAITAVAITATLSLWNMFAAPDKTQALAQVEETETPPPPPPTTEPAEELPTAIPTVASTGLLPIKIIYGGQAPQQQVIQVAAVEQPAIKKKNKNNNNNGGGSTAPKPKPRKPPSSGSSK